MKLKIILNFSIYLTIIYEFISATPISSNNRSNQNNNSNSSFNNNNKSQGIDEVTAYPDTLKLYVDLTNVSPDVSDILKNSKLNIDHIREQQERLRNRLNIENDKNRYEVISSSTSPMPISQDTEENYRLLKIQSELQATLRADNGESEVQLAVKKPKFEYAFAAACDIPRYMNFSGWFDGTTWNIMFKPIYRRYNVISSTIRLFKIKKDEDTSISNECDSLAQDEMYTISVSVYVRKRKQIKKRIIFTRVIKSSYVGWIEIDALGTLSFWDQVKNNHGIAVDVYDENEEPLDAKEHFRLQSCNDQAEPVLPWAAFEFITKQTTGTDSSVLVEKLRQMHNYPRLDIISTTPPVYDEKSTNNDSSNNIHHDQSAENIRSQRHIRHENHHKHHIKNDNTATILKNKFHKRKEHLHRDDNSTTGET